MPALTRKCAWCGVELPLQAFPPDPKKRSGASGVCRTCKPPVSDHLRKIMCTSKNRYADRVTALGVAVKAARRQKQLRVYECPLCHGWHLTKKEATQR